MMEYGFITNFIVNIDFYYTIFDFPTSLELSGLAVAIILGLVGCVITGILVTELKGKKKFKKMLIFLNIANVISFILLTYSMFVGNIYILLVMLGLFGTF